MTCGNKMIAVTKNAEDIWDISSGCGVVIKHYLGLNISFGVI